MSEKNRVYNIPVRKTGNEIDHIVHSLITHANDSSEGVRDTVLSSLSEISLKQHECVFSSIASFIARNAEVIHYEHRVQLLNIMHRALENTRDLLSDEFGQELIKFAVSEMIFTNEVKTEWQTSASQVLVSLARPYPNVVIDSLLDVFRPGVEPHYYVMRTLSDMAPTNPFAITPRLKDILSRIVPVLGLIKKSPTKWVFTVSLGRFAEAINLYISNAESENQPCSISISSYSDDFASSFDVVFSKWYPAATTEGRLRFAMVEALGHMVSVLSPGDFDSRYQKLVPLYLSLLKKEPRNDHLPIIQGLLAVINRVVTHPLFLAQGEVAGLLLSSILSGLHDLACIPAPETTNAASANIIKSSAEVLRCFEILCRALPDVVLTYVVNKFQIKATSTRVGSLLVIRHLVNSLESQVLGDRRSLILSSVISLVSEPDLSVRRAMLQTIASMANQSYFALDGSETLMKFVVQQCAVKIPSPSEKPAGKGDSKSPIASADKVSPEAQLKRAAEHMLVVFAARVPTAVNVMWPFLLELLKDNSIIPAFSVVFKSIADIAEQKEDENEGSSLINFDEHVNVPSPQFILARLFLYASLPKKQRMMGPHAVSAMLALSSSLHSQVVEYWEGTVPALLSHLESHEQGESNDFNVTKWQDTILKVYRESVALIANEHWLGELAIETGSLIKSLGKDHESLRITYRFLGSVLSRIQNKQIISELLDLMVTHVDHTSDIQQRGCAQGLGLIGNPHLDVVLPKITDLLTKTNEEKKPSGGFFSSLFSSDDVVGVPDTVKATAILAYGYVTGYANPDLILSRIDVQILHNILPLLGIGLDPKAKPKAPPTTALKSQIARSLDLIAKAVHPSRLPPNQSGFRLKKRDELIQGMTTMLSEKPSPELRTLSLATTTTLMLLEPPVGHDLLDKLLDKITAMLSLFTGEKDDEEAALSKGGKKDTKDESQVSSSVSGDDEEGESLPPGDRLMQHILNLLAAAVQADPSVNLVLLLAGKFEPILLRASPVVRERAMLCYLHVLKRFVPKLTSEKIPQSVKCVPELGKRLAFVLSRVNDTSDRCRIAAVEATQALLYIDQLLADPEEPRPRNEIRSLSEVRGKIVNATQPAPENAAIANAMTGPLEDLASLVASTIVSGETIELIRALIPRICGPDIPAAIGAGRVLTRLIQIQAADARPQLKEIMIAFQNAIKRLDPQYETDERERSVGEASNKGGDKDKKKPTTPAATTRAASFAATIIDEKSPVASANEPEVKNGCLAAFASLARVHFDEIMTILLRSPTPLSREVKDLIAALADPTRDEEEANASPVAMEAGEQPSLSDAVVVHLVNVINDTPLDAKSPTPVVMCATTALSVVFNACEKNEDIVEVVAKHYPSLLCSLLMRCGTAQGVDEGISSKQAVKALRDFFTCIGQDKVIANASSSELDVDIDATADSSKDDDCWKRITTPQYDDGVTVITRAVCSFTEAKHPALKRQLLTVLAHFYSQQSYVGQRVVATAMIAEFVSHASADLALQTKLIQFMLPCVADKVPKVRKQALRGLGNLVEVWGPHAASQANAVMSSLSGASEDSDPEVAAEAVASLTRVAKVVDHQTIGPMLISICFRLRAAFDRKQVKVRRSALLLFSTLCRFGVPIIPPTPEKEEKDDEDDDDEDEDEEEEKDIISYDFDPNNTLLNNSFLEQVFTNLPVYLVHSNDKDTSVRDVSRQGLKRLVALLHPKLQEHCKNIPLYDEQYDQFCFAFAKYLAEQYGDQLRGLLDNFVALFTSQWNIIRANAVYATACIIHHVTPEVKRRLNVHTLSLAIVKLLDHDDARVRTKAAKGLRLLYDI